MTIKNETINPDTALFEKKIKRHSSWLDVSEEAGAWLKKIIKENFPSWSLYFFISDTHPIENNKINKYRGMLKRKSIIDNKFDNLKVIFNGYEVYKSGIVFYSLLLLDESLLRNAINYCRVERKSFIFLSKADNLYKFPSNEIIKRRKINENENIDTKEFIYFLINKNFMPIRVFGDFDDMFLYCEIYGEEKPED